jgi:hypothetical protein
MRYPVKTKVITMQPHKQPSLEECKKYFYLVDNMHLYWEPRSIDCFDSNRAFNIWNSRFANKAAGYVTTKGNLTVRLHRELFRAAPIIFTLQHHREPVRQVVYKDGNPRNTSMDNLEELQYENSRAQEYNSNGKKAISIEYIKECFNVDTNGNLIWKERPVKHFRSLKTSRLWNSIYPGTLAGYDNKGRIYVNLNKSLFPTHRLVWALHHGSWPINILDHIDGDPSNNAISNLRDVSLRKNAQNARIPKNNSSGYSGLSLDKRRSTWRVQIMANGKMNYFGSFKDKEQAIRARNEAYQQLGFTERHGI